MVFGSAMCVSRGIGGRSVVLEGPESCSWKRPLLCPDLDYLKAGREWGGPLHATGTGLSGARKFSNLSRKE